MINSVIQAKLTTGEEIVGLAVKFIQNGISMQEVVVIERMVVTTEDEDGMPNGTSVFYTMKPWLLYSFDWPEPQTLTIDRSSMVAIIKPHEQILKQYEVSKVSLRQETLKGASGEFFQTLDSDEFDNYGIFESMVKPERMN